jgi:hypothetical protein
VRSACELLDQCRDKRLVVAYVMANKMVQGDSITSHHLKMNITLEFF